ncbi:glycoside hydrolase family 10 protein [Thermoflavifilum aggregans]|nr:family 10 glycosylhydrolase [Thermoflavifilum aggregans]
MLNRKTFARMLCRRLYRPMRWMFLLCIVYMHVYAQVPPKWELRGAWIATVGNIDWPSKPGLPADRQKAEYVQLLDSLQHLGINAVFVQIRPAADAFYASSQEPWSYWLSGEQGKPPYPLYDPLQFMIEEAHKRGMEFHAWLNPYRAVFNIRTSKVAANHITRRSPQWFLAYGDKLYFNPGLPAVWHYLTGIIADVVRRYDVDGIHFDDYFYPYRIPGKEFPDQLTYATYGHGMTLDDWRRHNVDTVIEMIHDTIQAIKPWVKFGVSPFGVWRNQSRDPEGSQTYAGQTNYDDLYADVLKWLRKGWIDYVVPQLYWEFGFRAADYGVLLDWWARHTYGRALYIGMALYRVGGRGAWSDPDELPRQLLASRSYPQVQGQVYFSASVFYRNPLGFDDSLRHHFYRFPAIVPPMPWKDHIPPASPKLMMITPAEKGFTLWWENADTTNKVKSYVIYRFAADDAKPDFNDPRHIVAIVPDISSAEINHAMYHFTDTTAVADMNYAYAITALNRLHNESAPSAWLNVWPRSKFEYRLHENLYPLKNISMLDYRTPVPAHIPTSVNMNLWQSSSPSRKVPAFRRPWWRILIPWHKSGQ